MDYGEIDKRGLATWGQVHEDGGPGDGGAPHQTPRGPDTYSGESGLIPGPPPGAHSGGHHRGYGEGGRRETLGKGRTGGGRLHVSSSLASAVQRGKRGA